MLTEISQLDTDFLIYLNNLGNTSWDAFWLYFTEKRSHIPLMLVLLLILYRFVGWKRFIVAIIVIGLMAAFTDQITNLVKHHYKRLRPCRNSEILDQIRYIAKRCSKYGYFSGHSSNSMAIAVFFSLLLKTKYPKGFISLLIWALCMGYSRIYVGVHYPGDVISGFAFGAFSGFIFYKLYAVVSTKWLNFTT